MGQSTLITHKNREMLLRGIHYGRGIPSRKTGKRLPNCPFCGKPVEHGDLHEGLISRGQVRGHKDIDLIYSRYNCVERHHDTPNCKHTGGVGGDEAFRKCAIYLAHWESEEAVREWLEHMAVVFPQVGKEALQRFNSVMKER